MSNNAEPEEDFPNNPIDSENTLDEHSDKNGSASKDTSSPGRLTESGLPYQEGLIGRRLGSGVIKEHIGSGGMGDVYKIWNDRLEKYRAVKLLKHGNDKLLEKRFEREIKITAAFDHPNIVRVIDAQRWKGYLYLEMEYVKGCALDEMLQNHRRFPPLVCIAIGILVARALHYAHNLTYTIDGQTFTGVIHRDLKPSNIMLADDGTLKLMDFGIARPVGGELATLTMGVVGSWVYLPPEQLDGCSVDFRADIYTLGEVLYELLTGKTAFNFNNQREFCECKSRGRYPPITTVVGRGCQALAGIIDKCLKVNPVSRFQSASELGTELVDLFQKSSGRTPEQVVTSFVHDGKCETDTSMADTVVKSSPRKRKTLKQTERQQRTRVRNDTMTLQQRMVVQYRELLRYLQQVKHGRWYLYGAAGCMILTAVVFALVQRKVVPVVASTTLTSNDTVPDTATVRYTTSVLPLEAPVIQYPVRGDSIFNDTISFLWNAVASAKGYALHLSATNDFIDTVFIRSGFFDTSYAVSGFKRPGTMFWRAGVIDSAGTIVWAAPGMVYIVIPPPNIPVLVSPRQGEKGCDADLDFAWGIVPDADSYRVQVATDSAFNDCTFDQSGRWSGTVTIKALENATDYYWRVRAERKGIAGDWSPVAMFSVADNKTVKTKKTKSYAAIAVAALRKNDLSGAEIAIANMERNDPRVDTLRCRLTDMYIIDGNISKATFYLNSITLKDMFTEVLLGKVLLLQKKYDRAYSTFVKAAAMKTIFNYHQVHSEAIYYKAVAAQNWYNLAKNETRRKSAINAWEEVWRLYKSRPSHIRFKTAVRESRRLVGEE